MKNSDFDYYDNRISALRDEQRRIAGEIRELRRAAIESYLTSSNQMLHRPFAPVIEVTAMDLCKKILDHLGLKQECVASTPARVDLVPVDKGK